MTETKSLYERIGGTAAIDAAVDVFYRKVLTDDRISHLFDTVDMERQHIKQKAFLTMALGGPNHYTGAQMREAHAKMQLTEEHFGAVVEHLTSTLRQLGVSAADIGGVGEIVDSVKDDVLNR